MRIMVRHAVDDFHALKIANAMESVGATVFSITATDAKLRDGAMEPSMRYTVWAKIADYALCDAVDEQLEE